MGRQDERHASETTQSALTHEFYWSTPSVYHIKAGNVPGEEKRQRVLSTANLNRQARLVIGLHTMGYQIEDMPHVLSVRDKDLGRFVSFARRLLRSKRAAIRLALQSGLPSHLAAPLPRLGNIRCPECGMISHLVPCVRCAIGNPEFVHEKTVPYLGLRTARDVPLTVPVRPTSKLPGSPGKLRIMRRRIARGNSAFHPEDATFED